MAWDVVGASLSEKYVTLKCLHKEHGPNEIGYLKFRRETRRRYPSPLEGKARIRIHYPPAERVEINYCDGLLTTDRLTGKTRKTHLFAAASAYSDYTFGEFSFTQKQGEFIASQDRMFAFYGGEARRRNEARPASGAKIACEAYELPHLLDHHYVNLVLWDRAVGLVPCPTALAALSTSLATGDVLSGMWIVGMFSLGMFISLSVVGLLISSRFSERLLDRLRKKTTMLSPTVVQAWVFLALGLAHVTYAIGSSGAVPGPSALSPVGITSFSRSRDARTEFVSEVRALITLASIRNRRLDVTSAPFKSGELRDRDQPVIVAVAIMRMMEMIFHKIISVVRVRNRLVAAIRSVAMRRRVARAGMRRGACVRIRAADFDRMFLKVPVVSRM